CRAWSASLVVLLFVLLGLLRVLVLAILVRVPLAVALAFVLVLLVLVPAAATGGRRRRRRRQRRRRHGRRSLDRANVHARTGDSREAPLVGDHPGRHQRGVAGVDRGAAGTGRHRLRRLAVMPERQQNGAGLGS